MDILKDDFCIKLMTKNDKTLYSSLARKIYNRYKYNYPDTTIQYDYYNPLNSRTKDTICTRIGFYGFRQGMPESSDFSWGNNLSLKDYKDQVYYIIDGVKYKTIDSYSII